MKVTGSIVKWCHLKAARRGRDITLNETNEVRDRGFRIIIESSFTKSVVFNYATCRKLRGKMGIQIMTGLLISSFEEVAPFIYCTGDILRAFKVKFNRREVKRYGSAFPCLANRRVHI